MLIFFLQSVADVSFIAYTCNMISLVKYITSVVLLCSFMLQITANILLWTHYESNKSYISKVLCEKKDIPDNCCKGKCFLKKQIDKQEELPNTANSTSQEQKNIKYQSIKDTFLDNIAYFFQRQESYCINFHCFAVHLPLQNYFQTLEKPPQVSFYS